MRIWSTPQLLGQDLLSHDLTPKHHSKASSLPSLAEISLICLIIYVGATVRWAIGFGEALIAMPLLGLIIPLSYAAPLVAMISFLNGIGILIHEWRHIQFHTALGLILPALLTVPLGVWLLHNSDDGLIKGLLAILILLYGVFSLRHPERLHLKSDRWAPVAGLIAGFLAGAYNTSGPPIVMYGTLRHWPPERFRAMLQSFFSFSSIWVLAMHFAERQLTIDVAQTFVFCLPSIALARWTGLTISKKIPAQRFRTVVHCALLVLGTALLAHACWPQ